LFLCFVVFSSLRDNPIRTRTFVKLFFTVLSGFFSASLRKNQIEYASTLRGCTKKSIPNCTFFNST
jgi:hypothetical protein